MSNNTSRKAKPPFDHDTTADLIIRTADNVDFRVHKVILAKASPIFDSILSLPNPPPEYAAAEDYVDEIPVLQLTESNRIVDIVLRCCYSISLPPSLTFMAMSFIIPLYRAAQKYEAAIVSKRATEILGERCGSKDSCLQAYTIASHLELDGFARWAALTSLSCPEYHITGSRFQELELISAAKYLELVDFHERCREQLQRELCSPQYWVDRVEDFAPMFELADRESKCCAENSTIYIGILAVDDFTGPPIPPVPGIRYQAKQWAMEYLAEISRLLNDDRMTIRDAIRSPKAASRAAWKAAECPHCRENALECVISFSQAAEGAISEIISSVSS
ncbi:hypothetical protein EIP86_005289 [Pleurotus ostreatoroseus]|nr:hypothetical protein EIP86_005289 [Pleurotus ostreatoroseus]